MKSASLPASPSLERELPESMPERAPLPAGERPLSSRAVKRGAFIHRTAPAAAVGHYQKAVELVRSERLGKAALAECWHCHNTENHRSLWREATKPFVAPRKRLESYRAQDPVGRPEREDSRPFRGKPTPRRTAPETL